MTFDKAPSHLPNAEPFLEFDIAQKKAEIFDKGRDRIRASAEYGKHGRLPWSQITVKLPLRRSSPEEESTTSEEDLAIVWELMRNSTRYGEAKESEYSGNITWTMSSYDLFQWLGIDFNNTKPVNKYVHPVKYNTGSRAKHLLKKKIAKNLITADEVESEMKRIDASVERTKGEYHWSAIEECQVIYKKTQPSKEKHNELQLTIKFKTRHIGQGDPRDNNGYLGSGSLDDMDPDSEGYQILKNIHAMRW